MCIHDRRTHWEKPCSKIHVIFAWANPIGITVCFASKYMLYYVFDGRTHWEKPFSKINLCLRGTPIGRHHKTNNKTNTTQQTNATNGGEAIGINNCEHRLFSMGEPIGRTKKQTLTFLSSWVHTSLVLRVDAPAGAFVFFKNTAP